jgi:hypothetical protein
MTSLILLGLMVVMRTQSISIIEGEFMERVESLGGAPPPVLNHTTSCPCEKLIISSIGPAATLQPKSMGIYSK